MTFCDWICSVSELPFFSRDGSSIKPPLQGGPSLPLMSRRGGGGPHWEVRSFRRLGWRLLTCMASMTCAGSGPWNVVMNLRSTSSLGSARQWCDPACGTYSIARVPPPESLASCPVGCSGAHSSCQRWVVEACSAHSSSIWHLFFFCLSRILMISL